MPSYRIAGIDVQFPFEAYDCQIVYMERVIHALQRGCNALLESPTGTGKTLCLLCATLAWRESLGLAQNNRQHLDSQFQMDSSQEVHKSKLPTIIYASRTHSQLQQVIRELKSTAYRPKMVVLGSREQMCIHKDIKVLRGRAQNQACRALCKSRSCYHQNRVADYLRAHPDLGEQPFDMEDLVDIGRTQGPCPYYLSREVHNSANMLFAPYNYLIDKDNRRSLTGIRWENCVLIFDEAHNLESICAEAASFDLSTSHLTACIEEARKCVDIALVFQARNNAAVTAIDPENFAILKALLLELEKRVNNVTIESEELGFTRPGRYIYEFLAEINITWETVNMLIDTIDHATDLLEDEVNLETVKGQSRLKSTTLRLQALRDVLQLIFRGRDGPHADWYRFHIHEPWSRDGEKGMRKGNKPSRVLSWWCFNPGIAMEEFASMGVRSVILTSGTLAPLDSFAIELRLPFDVRIENPHVIGPNQIWAGVVCCGPSGRPLNSSYRTRDTSDYKFELGNSIVNFARIVPDGLLVFFPSYYVLNQCIETWQTTNQAASAFTSSIWERICKHKQPVVEPKESSLFSHANEDFMTKLNDSTSSGAIFFAVCRGKVSEGLDFADRAGRAVVITGIPYAMKTDPKVRLKREYLDEQARLQTEKAKALTGDEWYVQQASRAVNQAIGRVIRHRNDYGAIILCDERLSQGSAQSQMSLWLRPHIQCYSRFGDAAFTLTRFFRDRVATDYKSKPAYCKSSTDTITQVHSKKKSASHMDVVANTGQIIHPEVGEIKAGSFGFFGQKTGVSMGFHASCLQATDLLTRKQSLSAILAAGRGKAASQHLSSIAITPANCAIGSADGIVRAISATQMDNTTALNLPQVNQKNSETVDKVHGAVDLGSVSPSVKAVSAKRCQPSTIVSERESTGVKCLKQDSTIASCSNQLHIQISNSLDNDRIMLRNIDDATPLDAPCDPVKDRGNANQQEATFEVNRRNKNAAKFLKEVKTHLSALEYKGFLECMRGLKQQLVSMGSLIENVSNLFSAPERIFLLHRFGDFVPSQHRDLYEKLLAAKCAVVEELSARTFPGDNQDHRGLKPHTGFGLQFPSKS